MGLNFKEFQQLQVRGRKKNRRGFYHQDGPDRHQGRGPCPLGRHQAPQRPRPSGSHKVIQEAKRKVPQKVYR